MKLATKSLIIVILSLTQLFNSTNAQEYSTFELVDTTSVFYKEITLSDVFNVLQVRAQAQTILPQLSEEERVLIDPEAVPSVIGVVRRLEEPFVLSAADFSEQITYPRKSEEAIINDSLVILTSHVKSEGAGALRIKFTKPDSLSEEVKIFVYTTNGEIFEPYRAWMFYENILWSHVFFAEEVLIQIQIPLDLIEEFQYILVEDVNHIDNLAFIKAACLEDVNCATANSFSGTNSLRRAVAGITTFGLGPTSIWCSGALLSNSTSNQLYQPLFQTVGHCINTQSGAQNAAFFFDYRTILCNSGAAAHTQVLRANRLWSSWSGMSSSTEDYALLLLEEKPSINPNGRVYLGWTTASLSNGDVIHNVSHPAYGDSKQKYARANKSFTYIWERCTGLTTDANDYSKITHGTTLPGSSGSPWVNTSGLVVGAHRGKCGSGNDPCNYNSFYQVSARMAYFFPSISGWLQGTSPVSMTISTNSLNFGNINANTTSTLNLTFTNQSTSGFNIDLSLSFTGTNASQFRIVNDGVVSTTANLYIAKGKSRTIQIRFQPNCGGSMGASLRVVHNATNISSPHNISLSGCAIPAQPGTLIGQTTACSGTQYIFSIPSVCGATSYNWEYSGGGTPIGSGTSVILTPTSSGTLRVRAVNSCGSSSWRNQNLVVNALPLGVSVGGGGTHCSSATLSATGGSGGTIYWQGTNSNGTSTTTPATSRTVTSTGTYYFRANNSCGWGTPGSVSVTINDPPSSVIVSGGGTHCNSTLLYASGGNGGTVYWQGANSNGTSTSTPASSQTVSTSGTYYFRAYNNCGWSAPGSATVTIVTLPGAVSVSGGGTYCNTATLYASGGAGGTIYWQGTNGNGTSTATPANTYSVTSSGTYCFRAHNSCGWGSPGSVSVTINQAPQPVTLSGGGTHCDSTVLYASGGNGGVIYWQGTNSNGTSTATPASSQSITASGTYYFRAYNNCGWGASGSANVVILTIPPSPGVITGNTNPCQGSSYSYDISPLSGASSYVWTITPASAGSVSGSGSNVSVQWASGYSGSANLSVYAVNNCGQSLTSPQLPITIQPLPGQAGTPTGISQRCQGAGTDQYTTNGASNAVYDEYDWVLSPAAAGSVSGNTTSATVTWNPAFSGTAYLKVRGHNGCGYGDYSSEQSILVSGTPIITLGDTFEVNYQTYVNIPCSVTGGSGNYQVNWQPAQAFQSNTVISPTTALLTAGTNATLTVTDAQSACTAAASIYLKIKGGPLAASVNPATQDVCAGEATFINYNISGGSENYTVTINPGNITFIPGNPSGARMLNPTTTTNYTFSVFDGVNTVTQNFTINVNPLPNDYTQTPQLNLCLGESGHIILSGSEIGVLYQLYRNGIISGAGVQGTGSALPLDPVQLGGNYTVRASRAVTDCGRWLSGATNVSVHSYPLADAGANQSVNYGNPVSLSASPPPSGNQYAYQWAPASLLNNSSAANPSSGAMLNPTWFHLTVTDNVTGCSGTDSVFIDVIGGPLQAWASQSQLIVCAGESVQLQGYATNGTGNYSFAWTSIPAGLNSSSQNISVTLMQNTAYVLTVSDGNESLSDTLSVVLCNTPQNLHTITTDVHSVSLSWDPVPGALEYAISHKKSSQQQWSSGTNVLTNQATVNNLDELTAYDFRVRANCGGLSQCTFSDTVSVTTLACANNLANLVAGQAYPQQLLEITSVSFLPQVPVPGSMVTMMVSWKMNTPSSRMLHANAYGSWDTLTPLGSLFAGNATSGSSVLSFVAPVSPGYHPVRLLFAFDEEAYSNYTSSNLPSVFHCATIGHTQTFRSDVLLNVQYCQPPGNVLFTDIGSQTARINWSLQPLALSYEVHYRDTSSSVWNTQSGVTANFLDLTALIPNTIYEVSVGSHCALGSISSLSPPAYLVTDDSCFTPVNLSVSQTKSSINPNVWSLHLQWNNAGSGATYIVQEFIFGDWVNVDSPANNYSTLNRSYSVGQTVLFRVRTVCNNGDFSPWSNSISYCVVAPVFSLDSCWMTDIIDINSNSYYESLMFHFDPEVDFGSHSVYLELSKYDAASYATTLIGVSDSFEISPGSTEDISFTVEADNINNVSYSFILKVFYAGFSSPEAIWTDTTDPCLGWVPMAMYKKVDLTQSWLSYKVDLNGDTYNEQVWIAAQLRSTKDSDREVYLEVQGRTSTTPFTFLTYSDTLLLRSKTTDTIVVPVEAWLQGNYVAYFRLLVYDQDGFVTSFIAPGGHPLNAVKMQKASAPLLSLSAAGIGYGSVSINGQMISNLPYTSSYTSGTGMLLEAFPDPGSQFSGWKGDFISSANPLIFNLDTSIHLSVLFDTLDPGWNKPIPTTSIHRIFIPDSLSITVNGVPASPGDMLGVFYDSASVDRCAGQASWDGNSKTMLVYGEDGLGDNGFSSGEVFRWKLYQASSGLLFDMDAEYQPSGTVFTHDSCFASGGLSGLSRLSKGAAIPLSVNAGPDQWGCAGQPHNINAVASGGVPPYDFLWSNGQMTAQFSATPMNTVSYVINVVDQMQNTARDTIVVFVDPGPVISLSANPAVVCRGESVTLTASGAPDYFWGIQGFQLLNDSQIEFVPQHSQVVNVYSGTFGGCAGQASVFVDVQSLPSTYLISPLSLCEGSTESLLPYASPSGGTFSGSGVMGSDFQAVGLPTNNWVHYSYEDPSTSCANSDSMLVSILEAPVSYHLQGGGDYCEDVQGVALEMLGSQSSCIYSIYRNDTLLSQRGGTGSSISFGPYQQSGVYAVSALNNLNGCLSMMDNEASLLFHPLPLVSLSLQPAQVSTSQNPVLLQGGDPAGGTYNGVGVSNGYFDPSQLPPGNVMVYYAYEDSLGCAGMDSATIEVLANSLIVDLVSFPSPPYCKDEQFQLCAYISGGTPPYSTNWFIPPFYGGIYMPIQGNSDCRTDLADASKTITVFVEDALGLSASVDFHIEVNDIQLLAQAVPWEVCSGDSIQLLATANGAQVFEWMVGNDTLIGGNHQYQPQMTGLATALVIDSNNCVEYADVFILVYPLPQANAGLDQSIQAGDTAVLQASGGLAYQWNTQPPSSDNPISVAPLLSTEYIVTVSDINNCVAFDSVWVYVSTGSGQISGWLVYQNPAKTPVSGCTVSLLLNGNVLQSTSSATDGYFEFLNVSAGNYELTTQCTQAWGGGNSNDALLVLKHMVGIETLYGIHLAAADVDLSSYVNSTDALNIAKRFVQLINTFPAGDWCIPQKSFTMPGSMIYQDTLEALCFGDVNGSYTPSGIKSELSIQIQKVEELSLGKDESSAFLHYPFITLEPIRLSALSLILEWPEEVQIDDISVQGSDIPVLTRQASEELRMAWYSLDPVNFEAGDTVFTMRIKQGIDHHHFRPSALPGSVLGDSEGNSIPAVLGVPAFTAQEGEFISIYPSPARDIVNVRFSFAVTPVSLFLRVTDYQGKMVFFRELTASDIAIGELHIGTAEMESGLYMIELLSDRNRISGKMLVIH